MATAGGIEKVRERVLQLAREIEDLSASNVPPATFFPEFLARLTGALNAPAGAIWLRDGGPAPRLICEVRLDQTGFHENPRAMAVNQKLLTEVLSTGQASAVSPETAGADALPTQHLIVQGALLADKKCVGVVQIFQRADAPEKARPGYLQFVEQMCGHASAFLERSQKAPLPDNPAAFWQSFERFVWQLQRSLMVREVAATATNDGRVLLGCDRLSLAVQRGRQTVIQAISGQDSVNHRANLVRAMTTLAERVIAGREPVTFAGKAENLPPQIEEPLANYIQESESRFVMVAPLFENLPFRKIDEPTEGGERPPERRTIGCLIIEQVAESKPQPQLLERIDLVADHVGAALANARQHQRIFGLRLWKLLGGGLEWFHGRKLAITSAVLAGIAAIVLMLWLVPWEYRIEGSGKLMPAVQRDVFAMQDGEVIELLVQGGTRVKSGQPLARMRNVELESQLLKVQNELIGKEKLRTALEAQIAELRRIGDRQQEARVRAQLVETGFQIDGLKAETTALEQRTRELMLHAPIDGVVTDFLVQQLLLGRPVNRGEILLHVMDDQGPWRLELEVEEHRTGHMLEAQEQAGTQELPVEFILATAPEKTYQGTLDTMATRAALSSELGNVVEVYVKTDVKELPEQNRFIGAEVRAKISCGPRSLGYVLFGDVVEFVRKRFWL